MERETLYKYFDGKASDAERASIKQWLESSPEHMNEIISERKLFDASMLLADEHEESSYSYAVVVRRILWEFSKIAAIVAIVATMFTRSYNDKIERLSAQINTISVPAGQRVNITLPDGTNVWLNARSELKYPSVFKNNRTVSLVGQGYFDVAKDKSKPFVVKTNECDVEVLGTKFDVESYDGEFQTSLMEGAVMLTDNANSKTIKLKPNEKAIIENGNIIVSDITDFDEYRWKEGLICFKNTNFIDLMAKFEKCYGIKIVVKNKDVERYVCSGKFRMIDGVENALRILQKDVRYKYERDKEDSIIYIK